MESRICSSCQIEKPLEYFYKDRSKPLSRDYICAECRKLSNRIRDRERDRTPDRISKAKEWLHSDKGKERARQRYKEDYSQNKQKYSAQRAIKRLIDLGIIIRQPCEVCGDEPSLGHHPDYSQPLKVVWLCQKHHKEIHRK